MLSTGKSVEIKCETVSRENLFYSDTLSVCFALVAVEFSVTTYHARVVVKTTVIFVLSVKFSIETVGSVLVAGCRQRNCPNERNQTEY